MVERTKKRKQIAKPIGESPFLYTHSPINLSLVYSNADEDQEDLWDFGTVRHAPTARQATIGRANPQMPLPPIPDTPSAYPSESRKHLSHSVMNGHGSPSSSNTSSTLTVTAAPSSSNSNGTLKAVAQLPPGAAPPNPAAYPPSSPSKRTLRQGSSGSGGSYDSDEEGVDEEQLITAARRHEEAQRQQQQHHHHPGADGEPEQLLEDVIYPVLAGVSSCLAVGWPMESDFFCVL